MLTRSLKIALAVCLLAASAAVASQTETLRVEANATTVTVTGMTPGESVVVFCMMRETRDYVASMRRAQAVIADRERSGTVTYQPQGGIPLQSIIAAVELSSGRIAVGSRPETTPVQFDDNAHGFGRGVTDELTRLQKRGLDADRG